MERNLNINTPDGHVIYGTLKLPKENADKLVIFVHGFTGFRNEHLFFNGAKFFAQKGVATFRFDLYSDEKGGRTFTDCDTQTHVDDLQSVYDYFKTEYKKVYLVGHSWGGVVVLQLKLNVSGIILWEPSHSSFDFKEDEYKFNEALDAYLLNWGNVYVVGKKLHDETINIIPAAKLISGINSPIKIISAGNSNLLEGGKDYYKLAQEPKAFTIVDGASHCFDEEGAEEELFAETFDWIDKF